MLLQPRKLHNLSTEEALGRVAKVSLGRLVYSSRALPNVWPTSHLVDGDVIVIAAHTESELCHALRTSPLDALVIAYEVDDFDSEQHLGWCVVVTGRMEFLAEDRINDREGFAAMRSRFPKHVSAEDIRLLGIHAEVVSGYEAAEDEEPETA